MKRKKNHLDRIQPDKYRDGPKKPTGPKPPRRVWDDENLFDALEEWEVMRKGNSHLSLGDEEE